MMGRKRTKQKDFDLVYRAIFGEDKTKPKVKYQDPEKWRG